MRSGPKECSVYGCHSVVRRDNLCLYHWEFRNGAKPKAPPRKPRRPKLPQGKYRDGNGYVHLKVAPFYPGARPTGDKSRWTILEHRAIMSQMIGRPLLPNESVHHVNGIRDDNRPENLELWVKSQPAGQRARDLVAWAKDIMRIYEQIFAPPETPCPTQNRISIMPAENP